LRILAGDHTEIIKNIEERVGSSLLTRRRKGKKRLRKGKDCDWE